MQRIKHNSLIILSLIATLPVIFSGCWERREKPDQVNIRNLIDAFEKNWLSNEHEVFVFHDVLTKKQYLGDGWEFDSDVTLTRFPWPRFTPSGGSIHITWEHRMERRLVLKLLNISPEYPKDLVLITLNQEPLPMLDDHLPCGEYEFYIPSALQTIGQNQLSISIDRRKLPPDFQLSSIGMHSIRVTLGAIVRNSIQIGDQVRNSLLFAPPVGIRIPYQSLQKQHLQFSYGLYSTNRSTDEFSYSLKISLYETSDSQPVFQRTFQIVRNQQSQSQWKFIKQRLPALHNPGYLDVSFIADAEMTGSIDYLALSEMMIIPASQAWELKTESTGTDIVFTSISSVAANQIGAYGNAEARTPFLDGFARTGSLFTDVTATSNGEVASLMSMVTGKLPRDHGRYRNSFLTRELPHTFMEFLGNADYQSHAFAFSAEATRTFFSALSGFKRVYLSNPANDPIETVYKQLDSMLNSPYVITKPGFYWFHLSPDIIPEHKTDCLFDLEKYYKEPVPIKNLNLPQSEQERLQERIRTGGNIDDMRLLLQRNDERLAGLDQSIERIVQDLVSRRQNRRISMIVTSDRGIIRSLKSNLLSSDSLSQEVIMIPLITGTFGSKLQKQESKPALLTSAISATKVYELIVNLIHEGGLNGSTMNGSASAIARPIISEHDHRAILAFRKDSFKLIHCLSNPYYQVATTNLFNLDEDPSESINLVGKDPDFTRQFLDPVLAFCRGSTFYPSPRLGLEDETLAILQSLKYTVP